jgi:hypothetical protein
MTTLTKNRHGRRNGAKSESNPISSSLTTTNAAAAIETDDVFGMESWFGSPQGQSIVKDLMEASEDLLTNIIRSVFDDIREVNICLLALDRYEKYSQTRHKTMLIRRIVAKAAIKGRARMEGLQGAVGIVASDVMLQFLGNKLSHAEKRHLEEDLDRQMKLRAGQGQPSPSGPGI